LTKAAFRYRDGEITIAKTTTPLPIRWSRPLPSEPSSITISRDRAGRYFISCLCEFSSEALPITPQMTGIDLGLTDLFITSEGMKSGNPRHLKRHEAKLAYLQRRLAKKQKGSRNRNKLRHGCGHKVEKLPLSQRHWHCESCGHAIDRDVNAARNIRTAGLAGLACGTTGAGAAA
ncbi:MAG: RNA-guided endonuclease InsQ/TnpB family protein, partial [Pseudomonadota bacterium]